MVLEAVRVSPGIYQVPKPITIVEWLLAQEQFAVWRFRDTYTRLVAHGRHRMTLRERCRQYWYNGVHGNHYDTKLDNFLRQFFVQKNSKKIMEVAS